MKDGTGWSPGARPPPDIRALLCVSHHRAAAASKPRSFTWLFSPFSFDSFFFSTYSGTNTVRILNWLIMYKLFEHPVTKQSSCAQHTVRPNKPKHQTLEQ